MDFKPRQATATKWHQTREHFRFQSHSDFTRYSQGHWKWWEIAQWTGWRRTRGWKTRYASSAFSVMVALTKSSFPWAPHTWMSGTNPLQTPELGFEGHTSGPYLLPCLVVEWAGLQVMFWCLVRLSTGALSWGLYANPLFSLLENYEAYHQAGMESVQHEEDMGGKGKEACPDLSSLKISKSLLSLYSSPRLTC